MSTALVHPVTELRISLGLSIVEFAKKFRVDRTLVSKVEHGWRDSLGHEVNARIERATGGKLTAEALDAFTWPEDAPQLLRLQAARQLLEEAQNQPKKQDARRTQEVRRGR